MSDLSRRLAELSGDKQSLLERVLRRDGLGSALLPIRPRAPGAAELPLAYGQESLWFMGHLSADTTVYNLPSAIRLRGRLDRGALERAFGEITRRHEILRTRFPAAGGRPAQEILPEARIPIPVQSLVDLPAGEREARARQLAEEASLRPFDLAAGPLVRLGLYALDEDDHLLVLVFHHLIWDGWSIGVLSRELTALYQAFSAGKPSPLPELPIQYADYALWQREWLSGAVLKAQIDYWRDRLRGLLPLRLPLDRPRTALPTFAGAVELCELGPELGAAVEALSARAGTTPFMTLLAAFQILLGRWCEQDRIAVGTPIAGRRRSEVEGLIGHFANLLVLTVDLGENPSFLEVLARAKEAATGGYAHQDVPFEVLVEKLHIARDPSKNPLFQVMFAVHMDRMEGTVELGGLTVSPFSIGTDHSHFDLGVHLFRSKDAKEGIGGYVSYNKDLFHPATIARMVGQYRTLLAAIVEDPGREIASLPILGDEDRAWLAEAGKGAAEPAGLRSVVAQIEAHAADPAIGTLLGRARGLAGHLAGSAAVGLCAAPGSDPAVGILAALGAGITLVPLDPALPDEGLAAILEDAGVRLVLVDEASAPRLAALGASVLRLDAPPAGVAPAERPLPGLDEIAYLAYASGSRVAVTHWTLARRIARLAEHAALSPGEAMLATAPAGRDFFPVEILWPLSRGAAVVFATPADPGSIRCAHFTPRGLAALLASTKGEDLARFTGLRTVLCSGAPLRAELAEAFHRRLTAKLVYLYSPPEIASEVSAAVCAPGASLSGKPELPVQILDRLGRLVPVGVEGTIHAGDPLVKTADRGRFLADGTIAIGGAEERTILREGLRIELSSIEAALLRHPSIDACRVLARGREGGEDLIAYVVSASAFNPKPIEEHLRSSLPVEAIPSDLVPVSGIPFTDEGQIDEAALAALEIVDAALIERWEARLSAAAGGAPAKVVAAEPIEPEPLTHVSDLLPGFRPAKGADRSTTSTSGSLAAGAGGGIPAITDGGPLHVPEGAPRTLADALLRTAASRGGEGVKIVRNDGSTTELSYADLLHKARRVLGGLRAKNLRAGDRVILQLEELEDFFPAFWGAILGGIVPVTVSTTTAYDRKSAVVGKLYNTWELLKQPPVVASSHLAPHLAGVAALYRDDGATFRILSIGELADSPPSEDVHRAAPDDLAFLQLTSGSTGIPKCIQETHRGIIHHVLGVRQAHGYGQDEITLNWLPMDHSVPILLCHIKDTYLGLRQVHAKTEVVLGDPLAWLDLIERHRVTHTWSPNFGYKLANDALAKHPERRWDLSSLVYCMNGAEQVVLSVAEEFMRRTAPFGLRPGAMQPAFGMAELSTGITYASDWATGKRAYRIRKSSLAGVLEEASGGDEDAIPFVCVGRPLPGVAIRIVDAYNRVLPESVIGVLQIRAPSVTAGYLDNEEANREVFVGDGWFSSGDLAFLKDGRLTITGRQKEMIVCRGSNFYCYELEDAVSTVEGVEPTFVAACAVDDPDAGTDGLAIFFVPKTPGVDVAVLQLVKEKVTADFGIAPLYVIPVSKEAFPKTTSGKIQRTHLKKELAAGGFDALLKTIDLALENENAVPAWFHRPVWRRAEIAASPGARLGGALVVLDREGLGEALAERLGEGVVCVEIGEAFARLGPRRFIVNPGEIAHYEELLGSLAEDGICFDQVIHLSTYGRPVEIACVEDLERAQSTGAVGLLAFVQALARVPEGARGPLPSGRGSVGSLGVRAGGGLGSRARKLLVISSHTQARGAGDRIAFERAAVRGLVKAISHEWAHLDCRHVDLPFGDAGNVDRIVAEAAAVTKDWEIVHRDGARWVRRLESVRPSPAAASATFGRGDLILVTGGLGGVGAAIAKHLLEHHQVRLVLVGRTPLDGDAEAAERSDSLAVERSDSLAAGRTPDERRKAFAELGRFGGDVVYEAADVCDLPRLREIVARAEARFGTKLAGIFHLAGVFPTRLLAEETKESFLSTLRPKLGGALVLRRLLGEKGFFVGFDSVYSFFGGVAVGAYAAAGSALEAFVQEERRTGRDPSYCFAFSHWDELGMSRGYGFKDQSIAQGYSMIGARRGIYSLLAGLGSAERDLVVGLDGRRPNVRRHLAAPLAPTQRLAGYVASAGRAAPLAAPTDLVDRFGTPSRCEILEVSELPLTASGDLDRGRAAGLGAGRAAPAERMLPRTDLERTIAAAWREVLGVESIDVNTSFFSLGGQSILLIQLLSKLQRATGRELTVIDLFRYPTISALAGHLGAAAAARPSHARAEERAKKQQEAARQRIAPRGRAGSGERSSK